MIMRMYCLLEKEDLKLLFGDSENSQFKHSPTLKNNSLQNADYTHNSCICENQASVNGKHRTVDRVCPFLQAIHDRVNIKRHRRDRALSSDQRRKRGKG